MPRSNTAPGHKGATRASWADYNPRVLVKRIMDEHPTDGVDAVRRKVAKALQSRENAAYLEAFIHYAVDNAFSAIVKAESDGKAAKRRKGMHVVAGTAIVPAETKGPCKSLVQIEEERHAAEIARIKRTQVAKDNILRVAILDLQSPDGRLYRLLPLGDFIKISDNAGAFGRKLVKAGHKLTELLGAIPAATNEALFTAIKGK